MFMLTTQKMRLKQTKMFMLALIKSNQSILEFIQRTLFHFWELYMTE